LPDSVKLGQGGDNISVKMRFAFPLPCHKGLRFALREGGRTIAAGVITNILPDDALIDYNTFKTHKKK